jgi:exodeoxyribonuclease V alpha subunit
MNSQTTASTREVLARLVERVTFHNAENGFCVLRAKAASPRPDRARARRLLT